MLRRMSLPLLLIAVLAGCPGSDQVPAPPVPAHVTIDPPVLTLTDGATGALTVTVKDGSQNVITGAAVTWSSSAPDVVGVSAGSLAAHRPGQAVVTARSGQAAATATVTVNPRPVELRPDASLDQAGTVGSPLPQGPAVRVIDRHGNGVPDIDVAFSVVEGGGTVSPLQRRTDREGRASVTWTLGTGSGAQALDVRVDGLAGSPLRFTASAAAAGPAAVEAVGGADQRGEGGAMLRDTLVARLVDRYGNPIAGIAVTWIAISGGGAVTLLDETTGVDGRGRALWRLGTGVGAQRVEARAGGWSADFAATAYAVPAVETGSASNVTTHGAVLGGRATPNGDATTAWFEWAATQDFANASTSSPSQIGSGLNGVTVSTTLSGLAPATTYWFRTVARNAAGTVRGQAQSFGTRQPVPGTPHQLTARPRNSRAIDVAWTNPDAFAGEIRIQRSRGSAEWFAHAVVPGGSTSYTDASLQPATTYSYRLLACNSEGCSPFSVEASATTPAEGSAPSVETGSAADVTPSTATLRATVHPGGLPTTVWFEYGTSPTLAGAATTPPASVGSGTTSVAASAAVSSLTPGTTYYFRARGANGAGEGAGQIRSFDTPQLLLGAPEPQAPAIGSTTENATPQLRWSGVAGADGYWLMVAENSSSLPSGATAQDCAGCAISTAVAATSHTAAAGALKSGTAYTWQVRARSAGGGAWSARWTFRTPDAAVSPQVTGISPNPVACSTDDQEVTVQGSGFVPGARVEVWFPNGSSALPSNAVTYVSSTTLRVQIRTGTSAADWQLQVTNPDGLKSTRYSFRVACAATPLVLQGITPNPVPASTSAQYVVLAGTGFVEGARARFWYPGAPSEGNLLPLSAVTWLSSSQLRVQIVTGSGSGDWQVQVVNPDGQTTDRFGFRVGLSGSAYKMPLPGNLNWIVSAGIGASHHQGSDFYSIDFTQSGRSNVRVLASAMGVVDGFRWNVPDPATPGCPSGPDAGNFVRIRHSDGTFTQYFHLRYNSIPEHLRTIGRSVAQGEHIATMGQTGCATGIHLHFRVNKGSSTGIDAALRSFVVDGRRLEDYRAGSAYPSTNQP